MAGRCSSLVMGDFEVSRLRAAEVEIAVVQVEVIEADIAEVAVLDVRTPLRRDRRGPGPRRS